MLTPVFRLEQDDRFLLITIRAPYCKLAEAEVSYDGQTFLFHARPYFLRLTLPAEVVDDETGSCSYNSDSGQFTITVPKRVPGEHFARLDMLSELIKPQQTMPNAGRPVEMVGAAKKMEETEVEDSDENEEEEEATTINDELLYADQKLCLSDPSVSGQNEICAQFGYGFGWTRHGVLDKFGEEIAELIDLSSPDDVPIEDRTAKLEEFDARHFQEQHYLADLFLPEQLQQDALEFVLDKKMHLQLTEEDLTDLKDLKIRQLEVLTPELSERIGLSLVDILFGFHYDFRITLGEHNVESGWTISKLAPSLTFLVRWDTLRQAMLAAIRHSLVLPLIRNWDLVIRVLRDVYRTFKSGRAAILHCLLGCRRIFNSTGEFRYLLNQLFVDDLCLWIQSVPDELLAKLRAEMKQKMGTLTKADMLELDLDFIETQARLAMLKPLDSDDEEG